MNIPSRKRLLALCLTVLLTLSLVLPAMAASSATAADMRLVKTEGTVTLSQSSGRSLSVRDNMKLYNGYTVSTADKSYAWLTLDDEKAVKLDENTALEVRKKGKKLELLLKDGQIFFDVKNPLEAGETMNIRTSTMVTGIRGTMGVVSVSGDNASITLYEGVVEMCSLQSGITATVTAGQTGHANQTTAFVEPMSNSTPGFVSAELSDNPSLLDRAEAGIGGKLNLTTPDVPTTDTGSAPVDQNPYLVSDQQMANIFKTGSTFNPGSSSETDEPDADIPGSDTPGTGDGETGPYMVRETITPETLTTLLNQHGAVTITNGGSVTIPAGMEYTIPSGTTLTLEGVPDADTAEVVNPGEMILAYDGETGEQANLVVAENATLLIETNSFDCQGSIAVYGNMEIGEAHVAFSPDAYCSMYIEGTLTNRGDLLITGDTTVMAGSTITNYGYLELQYTPVMEGTIVNHGTLSTAMTFIAAGGKVINQKDPDNPAATAATVTLNREFYVNGGTVENYSLFETNVSPIYVYNNGTFTNSGSDALVVVDGSLNVGYFDDTVENRVGTFINEKGATLQNNGSVTVYANSVFADTGVYTGSAPSYVE